MKSACRQCLKRQYYAKQFDLRFNGENCLFECKYADGDPKNDIESKKMKSCKVISVR